MAGDQRARLLLGETDGEHGAVAAGALVHEPRAQHDDARAFLQAENAGHARRGDFADAVADDGRRA